MAANRSITGDEVRVVSDAGHEYNPASNVVACTGKEGQETSYRRPL
jgi:hypothetical protein